MQTAVVGTEALLSYRLNLDDFPASARAYAYFAEIEDLGSNETRKFRLIEPNLGEYNSAVVNIIENANGSYTLYEPSYMNVSLDFVLSFAFRKTSDSTRGPLLNAMEISRYVEVTPKTNIQDGKSVVLRQACGFLIKFYDNSKYNVGLLCLQHIKCCRTHVVSSHYYQFVDSIGRRGTSYDVCWNRLD